MFTFMIVTIVWLSFHFSLFVASAFVLPLLSNRLVTSRLIAIFMAFLPSYLLLSTSYPLY